MPGRSEKQGVMGLLRNAGLWEEADQFREAARQRLRDEGKSKQEAVEGAWDAMAEKFLPLVEQSQPPFQVILPNGAKCFDDILDPDYQETDDAAQMRDAYRWVRDEFPRIVEDQPAGTVVDYRLAETPPPVGWACNILETWAAKPRHKRDGLYREVRTCLGTVSSSSESEPAICGDEGGFLHEIGGWDDE